MATRRRRDRPTQRGDPSLVWDIAPIILLASASVALLQPPPYGVPSEARRGRQANSPAEIPMLGWRDILIRTRGRFARDKVPTLAAGVTFYVLLAISPAMAAFVALYSLFADVSEVQNQLRVMGSFLPVTTLDLLGEQMTRLVNADKGGQSLALLGGAIVAAWTSNSAALSLISSLNIAYAEDERRSWMQRTMIALAFTVGFLTFTVIAVALLTTAPMIEPFVGRYAAHVVRWGSWPVLLVLLTLGVSLLYRFGPSRHPMKWKWVTWGSATVVFFWVIDSALFSTYVVEFTRYDRTYGALGAVIGFMMWIYLWILMIIAGAELNAEIEHQTIVDTTIGAPRPRGFRRAVMADTVGAAQGVEMANIAAPARRLARLRPVN